MTIPEQAERIIDKWTGEVLARCHASSWHFGELWSALQPLLRVQRPEDVARVLEWQKIPSANKPATADAERSYLRDKLKTEPGAAVVTLLTYASVQPPEGSFAGSLWALAEYVNSLQVALALPHTGQAQEGPRCQSCRRALAVSSIRGTHGLCYECVAGGFALISAAPASPHRPMDDAGWKEFAPASPPPPVAESGWQTTVEELERLIYLHLISCEPRTRTQGARDAAKAIHANMFPPIVAEERENP